MVIAAFFGMLILGVFPLPLGALSLVEFKSLVIRRAIWAAAIGSSVAFGVCVLTAAAGNFDSVLSNLYIAAIVDLAVDFPVFVVLSFIPFAPTKIRYVIWGLTAVLLLPAINLGWGMLFGFM